MLTALRRAASAALGLLAVVSSQARTQESKPTLVAIVRADGVVGIANRFFVAAEYWHYEGGSRQLFELTRTSLTPSYPASAVLKEDSDSPTGR